MLLPQSVPEREKCQRSQCRYNYSIIISFITEPSSLSSVLILTIKSSRTETVTSRCIVVAEAAREIRPDLCWQILGVLIECGVGVLVAGGVVPAGGVQTVRDVLGAVLAVISRPA